MLDRIIPANDKHTVINEKRLYEIEVMADNLMTYRIPMKHAIPPMRIYIDYHDEIGSKRTLG